MKRRLTTQAETIEPSTAHQDEDQLKDEATRGRRGVRRVERLGLLERLPREWERGVDRAPAPPSQLK